MHIRPVHGRVAAGAPARALAQQQRMFEIADVNFTRARTLDLSVAFQAKVRIAFDQHLPIDGAVRVVANGAAFPQRFVLEDKGAGLLAVALGATFVEARHRQPLGSLEDVRSVRIVALDTVHSAFQHRMMLGQIELTMRLEVTAQARGGVLAGVDDELRTPAGGFDVLAAWPVTRFASRLPGHFCILQVNARVSAGGENARNIGVAICAGFIADVVRARNFRGRQDRARSNGAGIEQKQQKEVCRELGAEPESAPHS